MHKTSPQAQIQMRRPDEASTLNTCGSPRVDIRGVARSCDIYSRLLKCRGVVVAKWIL